MRTPAVKNIEKMSMLVVILKETEGEFVKKCPRYIYSDVYSEYQTCKTIRLLDKQINLRRVMKFRLPMIFCYLYSLDIFVNIGF